MKEVLRYNSINLLKYIKIRIRAKYIHRKKREREKKTYSVNGKFGGWEGTKGCRVGGGVGRDKGEREKRQNKGGRDT